MTCVNLSEVRQRFCIWDSFPIHYHRQALRDDVWGCFLGNFGFLPHLLEKPRQKFWPQSRLPEIPIIPKNPSSACELSKGPISLATCGCYSLPPSVGMARASCAEVSYRVQRHLNSPRQGCPK